jgi:uncharacterized protein HemX
MNRPTVIAAVVIALVLGVLAGYLWWGAPTQQLQADLQEAKARGATLEKQLGEVQAKVRAAESELGATQGRLKDLESRLASEQQHRSRLERVLSQGKK